jgi:hypothetical protein
MLNNLEKNRGIKPDAKSIQWLYDHPAFAAKMWHVLGMESFEIAQEKPSRSLRSELESMMPYAEFKREYPAAASVYDHVVEWCRPDDNL